MTHKPRKAASLETVFNDLPINGKHTQEAESLRNIPGTHNGHDHWKEIGDAISEKDIMEFRDLLQKIEINGNSEHPDPGTPFDLACNTDLHELEGLWPDDESEAPETMEPLPRIHLHHHRRIASETTHYFYKDQGAAASLDSSSPEEDDGDAAWLALEEAMRENDVISLRDTLRQIGKHVSSHQYTTEEIENYLEGTMNPAETALLEEELTQSQALRADINLSLEVEKAAGETDIMSLRETLGKVFSRENSTSMDLAEIEAFLYDEMDDAARSGFVNELLENRDLKSEVELVREIDTALSEKEVMALRDSLRQVSGEVYREVRKTVLPVSGLKNKTRMATVAALFLLLLGISSVLKFGAGGGDDLYNTYFSSPHAPGVFRSTDLQADRVFSEGLKLYNQGHYNSALLYFRDALHGEQGSPAAGFYAGASYQQLKQFTSAISAYDKVITHNNNLFVEQAEWYTALCYVGSGNLVLAGNQLEAVIRRGGFYKKDASGLLKRIRKTEDMLP